MLSIELAKITVESLLWDAEEARACAMESAQFNAAIREMGVLSGQRIERKVVGAPGEFEALSDDELERAIVDRLGRLASGFEGPSKSGTSLNAIS